MKIGAKTITTEMKNEIQIANYSTDDIKRLILSDLEKQGHTTELSNILFVTNWKYVSDEWGMNTHVVTTFDGARANIS